MSTTPHPSPLIPSAARAGLTFGLILVVMYTARILSLQVPLLQILYFFGVIIVPIVAYRGARAYRDYFYPTGPFKAGQGFSYVVLLHVFGGYLGLHPSVLLLPLCDAYAPGGLGRSPAHDARGDRSDA